MCFALLFTSWMTADPCWVCPHLVDFHIWESNLYSTSPYSRGLFDMFQGWLILEGYLHYANLGNLSKGSLACLTTDTYDTRWT
ncbi:hypothetical protein GDO81_021180 [Engystomops pustulosus]|uniref:Secreted protein n=1 Tax=Engystomops pustulosus TaxID=76066 RepID=A0AAV6YQM0_ENGPU|nr:hypothetical protein GDO81_021180 [Engystomops pustulosus]